jgi:hypothetical protein
MSRKFRKTEITGKVGISQNGQHTKANWFCINCHAIGSHEKHYPECENHESYTIPSTAEVPRKMLPKGFGIYLKINLYFLNQSDGGNIQNTVG